MFNLGRLDQIKSNSSFQNLAKLLLDPKSKLKTYSNQHHYVRLPEVRLHQMYRSLDILCGYKEMLEEEIFYQNRNLFNMQVDVVFYDVTTFSFESVRKDSLRDFGFSKDGKFKEVQVVMGLLIDREGRPIGYDLFPGNNFDGKTMDVALKKLEKRFGIRKVIIVADRERLIKKARSLLENKTRIKTSNKRGGKKYLKETRSIDWALDGQAILNDQMFDGYYGIQVSEKQLKPKDILAAYNNLWKIEESFRIMKTTLEVRLIFHWTEPRIKGHFVICFLAFLLEKTLESKLKKDNLSASPQEIREALNSMNFAEVKIKQKKFFIKTKFESLGNKILRLFRIKPPKNVTPARELSW